MIKERSYYIYTQEEKERLGAIAQANDEKLGSDYSAPYVSPEELKARMKADGIREEDNIFQRELMRMRYGGEADKK